MLFTTLIASAFKKLETLIAVNNQNITQHPGAYSKSGGHAASVSNFRLGGNPDSAGKQQHILLLFDTMKSRAIFSRASFTTRLKFVIASKRFLHDSTR